MPTRTNSVSFVLIPTSLNRNNQGYDDVRQWYEQNPYDFLSIHFKDHLSSAFFWAWNQFAEKIFSKAAFKTKVFRINFQKPDASRGCWARPAKILGRILHSAEQTQAIDRLSVRARHVQSPLTVGTETFQDPRELRTRGEIDFLTGFCQPDFALRRNGRDHVVVGVPAATVFFRGTHLPFASPTANIKSNQPRNMNEAKSLQFDTLHNSIPFHD
jgi:hypothetical protein